MKPGWTRREFLKSTAALMVFESADIALGASSANSLPKRRLGKTDEMVSIVGSGSGTRFCPMPDEDEAQALLERASDLGITYVDSAASYTRTGIVRLRHNR